MLKDFRGADDDDDDDECGVDSKMSETCHVTYGYACNCTQRYTMHGHWSLKRIDASRRRRRRHHHQQQQLSVCYIMVCTQSRTVCVRCCHITERIKSPSSEASSLLHVVAVFRDYIVASVDEALVYILWRYMAGAQDSPE